MPHFEILLSSVRTQRNSLRVALFFQKYIQENQLGTVSILDLNVYQFPVFEERLKFLPNPTAETLEFAERIKKADGIIMICPEYNGSFPASLKNVIDLLYPEWFRKPIGICMVSSGDFGGTQALISLQFVLWKIKAWTVTFPFHVANVTKMFDESGNATEPDKTNARASGFLKEILWCIEANARMAQ